MSTEPNPEQPNNTAAVATEQTLPIEQRLWKKLLSCDVGQLFEIHWISLQTDLNNKWVGELVKVTKNVPHFRFLHEPPGTSCTPAWFDNRSKAFLVARPVACVEETNVPSSLWTHARYIANQPSRNISSRKRQELIPVDEPDNSLPKNHAATNDPPQRGQQVHDNSVGPQPKGTTTWVGEKRHPREKPPAADYSHNFTRGPQTKGASTWEKTAYNPYSDMDEDDNFGDHHLKKGPPSRERDQQDDDDTGFCGPVHDDRRLTFKRTAELLEERPHGRNFNSRVERENDDCHSRSAMTRDATGEYDNRPLRRTAKGRAIMFEDEDQYQDADWSRPRPRGEVMERLLEPNDVFSSTRAMSEAVVHLADKTHRRTKELCDGLRIPSSIDSPWTSLYPHVHWNGKLTPEQAKVWRDEMNELQFQIVGHIRSPAIRDELALAKETLLFMATRSQPPTDKAGWKIPFEQAMLVCRIYAKVAGAGEKMVDKLKSMWSEGRVDLDTTLREALAKESTTDSSNTAGEQLAKLFDQNQAILKNIENIRTAPANSFHGPPANSFRRYSRQTFRRGGRTQ